MLAFEAILLPDNSVQITKPLFAFPRPRRIIITVLDEEVDTEAVEAKVPEHTFFGEQNIVPEVTTWSPHSTRIPNLHAGFIEVSDDFDAPLPDSFWLGEEEGAASDGSAS